MGKGKEKGGKGKGMGSVEEDDWDEEMNLGPSLDAVSRDESQWTTIRAPRYRHISCVERECTKKVRHEGINSIDMGKDGKWEKVRVHIDSGAIDTVTPPSTAEGIEVRQTAASKSGSGYIAANGTKIHNYGEIKVKGYTEDWSGVSMCMQVADVKKTLGSAYRMNQGGNKIVLDGEDSYLVNKVTGKKTQVMLEDGQYVFYLWVKKEGKEVASVEPKPVVTRNRYSVLYEDDQEQGFMRQDLAC